MLPDADRNGQADSVEVLADRLNIPHGLVFADNKLLIANQDGVVQLERRAGRWSAKPVALIRDLPTGGHTSKSLKRGPDGYLYLNVGSSCNVCTEQDPVRATILRYSMDGQPAGALATVGRHRPTAIWASGLRNSQSFDWHPMTKAMYATNNGSDQRAASKGGAVNDDLPPEHLNRIEAGKHYGWPHCWGDETGKLREDPNFPPSRDYCQQAQGAALLLPAHSTPIGISFLGKAKVPQAWQQDALIALHGSWNRQQPEGYKIIRVRFESRGMADGKPDWQPVGYEDFATGWLSAKGAWGRPVDVAVGPAGDLYISDDRAGLIFRITYQSQD
jgi:glucose/arabinose dehydrogenase